MERDQKVCSYQLEGGVIIKVEEEALDEVEMLHQLHYNISYGSGILLTLEHTTQLNIRKIGGFSIMKWRVKMTNFVHPITLK